MFNNIWTCWIHVKETNSSGYLDDVINMDVVNNGDNEDNNNESKILLQSGGRHGDTKNSVPVRAPVTMLHR